MNATTIMKETLFAELLHGVRTTCKLIGKIEAGQWTFRPADNMRTLQELAHHLAAVPEVDLAIMQEADEAAVRKLEAAYARLAEPASLAQAMEEGGKKLIAHFRDMPDETFLTFATKPFYAPHGSVQAKWLVETVTHLFHHRAQLFQYLKQLGHAVNMSDLYG